MAEREELQVQSGVMRKQNLMVPFRIDYMYSITYRLHLDLLGLNGRHGD